MTEAAGQLITLSSPPQPHEERNINHTKTSFICNYRRELETGTRCPCQFLHPHQGWKPGLMWDIKESSREGEGRKTEENP